MDNSPLYGTILDRKPIFVLTDAYHFDICTNMESQQAVSILAALAQESRLQIFRLLVQHGREGLPAGVIAERCGVSAPTMSFHLAQLAHSGLVARHRQSRKIIYAADFGAMNGLLAYLTENCCQSSQAGACGPQGMCEPSAAKSAVALRGVDHETPARARRRSQSR